MRQKQKTRLLYCKVKYGQGKTIKQTKQSQWSQKSKSLATNAKRCFRVSKVAITLLFLTCFIFQVKALFNEYQSIKERSVHIAMKWLLRFYMHLIKLREAEQKRSLPFVCAEKEQRYLQQRVRLHCTLAVAVTFRSE